MSPGGSRFPRTPGNVARYEKGNASNEKMKKLKAKVEKVEAAEADVDVNEVEMKKLKMKNAELEVEVGEYRSELGEMQNKMMEMGVNMEMLEKMIETNEKRFEGEMNEELDKRKKLEARLDKDHGTDDLKVRELMVREKEVAIAEKKIERAAQDDETEAEAYECCLSISDPAGDVMCDVSMLRSLDKGLRNERNSVSTVASLLDHARSIATKCCRKF